MIEDMPDAGEITWQLLVSLALVTVGILILTA